MTDLSHIRAVRNNNPGNIRIGTNWQGLMPRAMMNQAQEEEHEFCVFATPKDGFRAMAEIFKNYARHDGISTLNQAISRWAPPSENNTAAYVKAVCDYTGYAPDKPFPFLTDNGALQALLKAVSIHEVGAWYFQPADLAAGCLAAP